MIRTENNKLIITDNRFQAKMPTMLWFQFYNLKIFNSSLFYIKFIMYIITFECVVLGKQRWIN